MEEEDYLWNASSSSNLTLTSLLSVCSSFSSLSLSSLLLLSWSLLLLYFLIPSLLASSSTLFFLLSVARIVLMQPFFLVLLHHFFLKYTCRMDVIYSKTLDALHLLLLLYIFFSSSCFFCFRGQDSIDATFLPCPSPQSLFLKYTGCMDVIYSKILDALHLLLLFLLFLLSWPG